MISGGFTHRPRLASDFTARASQRQVKSMLTPYPNHLSARYRETFGHALALLLLIGALVSTSGAVASVPIHSSFSPSTRAQHHKSHNSCYKTSSPVLVTSLLYFQKGMAETCIVCLGDLRTSTLEDPPPEAPAAGTPDDDALQDLGGAKKHTRSNVKRYHHPNPP